MARGIDATLRRDSDFSPRCGGEEFAVVMPDTPPPGATLIAERLREAIERFRIAHPVSAAAGCVSLSVGGVGLGRDLALERLIAAADEALCRAKRAGRIVGKLDANVEPLAAPAAPNFGSTEISRENKKGEYALDIIGEFW